MAEAPAQIEWEEGGAAHRARWRSERGAAPPRRVLTVDDTIGADAAHHLTSQGTALLWRGDYHQAVQLLQAVARRIDKGRARRATRAAPTGAEAFHLHRQAQAQRARLLGALLVPIDADRTVPLRRAPDLRPALDAAWGPPGADEQAGVIALRELQGLVGAHEWRRKGVEIPALGPPPGNRIHPHYGVFSPVRGEYVDLVAQAPWPPAGDELAFDVGTGTGVLAAVLARRGAARVVATDTDPRALACAAENLERLGVRDRVELVRADLFPPGGAGLVVCNPPWLPARPAAPIERAVYDEGGAMLKGFLAGLAAHLAPGGEGWLLMSDLAEHLGLRPADELPALFSAAGLRVLGRLEARPRHGKALDPDDPLHAARSAERTSLWRLAAA